MAHQNLDITNKKIINNSFTMAVVIPTYNRPQLLKKLLESIKNANWPQSLIGIWVIENGIKSSAEKIIQDYRHLFPVYYHFQSEPSVSTARNTGTLASNAEICIYFDDDIKIKKNTLMAYENAIKKYGLNNFYGGPLIPDYEKQPESWLSSYLPASAKGFYFKNGQKYISYPYFLGGNHAVPIKALKAVGFYDLKGASGKHNSGYLGEETRLQDKLSNLGYKGICVHKAEVFHYVPKENCTYKWLLQRKMRAGMTDASTLKKSTHVIMGVPLWVLRVYFHNLFKKWLYLLTFKPKEETTYFNLKAHYYKGVIIQYIKS